MPSSVTGPVESFELALLASICADVVIVKIPFLAEELSREIGNARWVACKSLNRRVRFLKIAVTEKVLISQAGWDRRERERGGAAWVMRTFGELNRFGRDRFMGFELDGGVARAERQVLCRPGSGVAGEAGDGSGYG